MASKLSPRLFRCLIPSLFSLIFLYSTFLTFHAPFSTTQSPSKHSISSLNHCNFFNGTWVYDPTRKPMYDSTCPFHRNAWNCLRNQRENMGRINSWKWVPEKCQLPRVDPTEFMGLMQNKRIGWQRKQSKAGKKDESEGTYRVDVDVPADDWAGIVDFYDVLVFNTGHWWSYDKFPEETHLVFYKEGQPILPPLGMLEGYKVVIENMAAYIQREIPRKIIKFLRLQSPRHFFGGEWNQNGSCLFDDPLEEHQLDSWFDHSKNGVNKEARQFNLIIREALQGTDIQELDFTRLSEFRADAHPAIWLGNKDAVAVWGQDCMHWCLPGVPDTWVDILSQLIHIA